MSTIKMSTITIQPVDQPLRSILLNPTTNFAPSTTENASQSNTPAARPTDQTPPPRLSIAIPDGSRDAIGQGSRRNLRRRGGSPPPPPPPPTHTPTIRFANEPQGRTNLREQRALQKLSTNGALRPPRPRRRHIANRMVEAELENAATDRAFQVIRESDDVRRATAEVEHAMATDPYVLSRSSYTANWVEDNDRVQHSEEPW